MFGPRDRLRAAKCPLPGDGRHRRRGGPDAARQPGLRRDLLRARRRAADRDRHRVGAARPGCRWATSCCGGLLRARHACDGGPCARGSKLSSRMARKIPVLGRMLGAPALFAIAYGEIGSSLYFALGITAVYALSADAVVFLRGGHPVRAGGRRLCRGRRDASPSPAVRRASPGARSTTWSGSSPAGRRARLRDRDLAVGAVRAALPDRRLRPRRTHCPTARRRWPRWASLVVITGIRLVRRTNVYMAGVLLAVLDLVVQISLAVLGLVLLFNCERADATTSTWASSRPGTRWRSRCRSRWSPSPGSRR